MSKTPTSPHTTQVQIAAPEGLAAHIHQMFHQRAEVKVVRDPISNGSCLLDSLSISRPDILLLDMTLPNLDEPAVLQTLGSMRFPPYVLAIAPRYNPYLAQVGRHRVVKGTLLTRLAMSPLLLPVLKSIAEGHEYFTPEASL